MNAARHLHSQSRNRYDDFENCHICTDFENFTSHFEETEHKHTHQIQSVPSMAFNQMIL